MNEILCYDDFFTNKEFEKILEYVNRPCWGFGHGSYDKSHPQYKNSIPFWGMNLDGEEYFTDYLLNIIQKRTNTKFDLLTVYANGHTFGTKGSFHQDWYDNSERTFLLYANPEWNVEWGGNTVFDFGNGDYQFSVPRPNTAIMFPGVIPHCADATTRLFSGLRVTIAWKLILK
jgi:hypothetical protein